MDFYQKAVQRYNSHCKKSGYQIEQPNQNLSSTDYKGNNVIVTLRNINGELFTTTFKKSLGV